LEVKQNPEVGLIDVKRWCRNGVWGNRGCGCWRRAGVRSGKMALRYVERNPLRAVLVARAEDWAWSSLRWQGLRGRKHAPELSSDGPVERGRNWQQSVNRGTSWGDPNWQKRTSGSLGLESSLRPRGRPRLEQRKQSVP